MSEVLDASALISATGNFHELIDLTQGNDDIIVEFVRPHRHVKRDRKRPKFYIPENEPISKSISPKKKKKQCSKKYIGSRIAKYFGHEIYLGAVTSADYYYHIVYDDDDEEDLDEKGLIEGLELYDVKGYQLEPKEHGKQKRYTFKVRRGASHTTIKRVNETNLPLGSSITSKAAKSMILHTGKANHSVADSTLFAIHNISKANIDSVRSTLQNRHQQSAELVSEFFLFCYERQSIWKRKRSDEAEELTKDAKMAKNFYCNVYRELDRGTAYFRYNLIHHRNRSDTSGEADWYKLEEVLWDSFCYRLLNKIETFERYGRIPNRSEWEDFVASILEPMWGNKEIVFTGAHQNMGKDRYLATIESLWQNDGAFVKELASQISTSPNLESCYDIVLQVNNVGKFFAWQVVCDLLESRVIRFSEDDWVKLGPGAVNGLKLIFGDESVGNKNHIKQCVLLREMQHQMYDALGLEFPRFIDRDMTLKNIEHSLCEFAKYKNANSVRKFEVGGKGSRSHLDIAKGCHYCNAYDPSRSKLCDLCRTVFCESCCDDICEEDGAWLCSECNVIEA